MKSMDHTIKDIGEKKLLQKLQSYLGNSPSIVRVFSEDCAVLRTASGGYQLFTTDVLIENVHFRLEYADARTIGRKAVLVNLSDISAMGGTPSFFMLSAGFQENTSIEFVEQLYEGMTSVANEAGITFVGGNVSQSPVLFMDIFMGGEVSANEALFRNGAKSGDAIFVSSPLGASVAGLKSLEAGYRLANFEVPAIRDAIQAHLEPPNHNALARKLASCKLLSSMIDLSDGLASDLGEICSESRTGARIELNRIPIANCVTELATRMNWDPQELALYGGEDYHLLFTVPDKNKMEFATRAADLRLYEIGVMTDPSEGIRGVDSKGQLIVLKKGFAHFGK
jgi:thiamine-monophosphate kinase